MAIYFTVLLSFLNFTRVLSLESGEIIKTGNKERVSIAFASCYDDRFNYKSLFKFINEDSPDVFIWHGDFAYISRTKRKNYFKLLQSPIKNLPEILFDQLLSLKSNFTLYAIPSHTSCVYTPLL